MTTLAIKTIETVPDSDPFNNNQPTYTELSLDCRDGELHVTQQMRTNSTLMSVYHGHVLTWELKGQIGEKSVRDLISQNEEALQVILNGYDSEWDGSNMVGRFTKEASSAIESMSDYLEEMVWEDYQVWDVDDWCHEQASNDIDHSTTDEELAAMVDDYKDSDVIIIGDILEYITKYRDEQIDEFEYENA